MSTIQQKMTLVRGLMFLLAGGTAAAGLWAAGELTLHIRSVSTSGDIENVVGLPRPSRVFACSDENLDARSARS